MTITPAARPLVVLGAGRMGGALLNAVAPTWPGEIFVVDPVAAPDVGQRVSEICDLPSLEGALVILSVKPQVTGALLPHLSRLAGGGALFISVVAGVSLARLRAAIGPEAGLVRAMPNTPAAIGSGVTGAYGDRDLDAGSRTAAQALLSSVGTVVWLENEAEIDLVTALSGSGPAYFFRLTEAMADAGVDLGLSRETAVLLARRTLEGAGALAAAAGDRGVSELRAEVTSPAGTTAAALAVFDADDRLSGLVAEAMDAAARRARELGALPQG